LDPNQGSSASTQEYSLPADTLRKKEIESQVDLLNSRLKEESVFHQIPRLDQSPQDTIEYWAIDYQPVRISIKSYSDEFMEWPTFFIQDTQLIMVRHRSWSQKLPTPWAMESMIYLQNGKIFYCEERRMDLAEGEIPGLLRIKPFYTSTRSFSAIEQDYKAYWENIRPVVIEQEKRHAENQ
jgi:hypothetical protein